MDKKINYPGLTIFLLAASIMVMSIGFAARSEKLLINGTTTIGSNAKWNVHFENLVVNNEGISGDLIKTPATISNQNSTFINFDISLPEYEDFYEFTVDMVNSGNIDAKISNVFYSLDDDALKYLDFKVSYVDHDDNILINDALLKETSKKIKVRIQNINQECVFEKLSFNVSFALEFVQKDE